MYDESHDYYRKIDEYKNVYTGKQYIDACSSSKLSWHADVMLALHMHARTF